MKTTPRHCLTISLILAAIPALLAAAPPEGYLDGCGTDPTELLVDQRRHEAHQRSIKREQQAGRLPLKMAPTVFQEGQVVVMQDDGTVVMDPNVFDLQGKAMQYLRRPKGMSSVRSALTYRFLIGDKVNLGDDSSIRVNFPAGFTYPFGSEVYTSVWVNSDGNLTFGSPDPSSGRDLASFINGPPRIAPLYTDLDPSSATGENGVYVGFPPGRVRITWLGVPEFGTNDLSTFQVTLFTTGRVNFAYGDEVEASVGVVGVAPFSETDLEIIDYDQELPFRPQRVALAEEFTDQTLVDLVAVTKTFYEHYQDRYQFIAVFEDFVVNLGTAFAFSRTVQNQERGFGRPLFDQSSLFGSDGTLETVLQMGNVVRYSADPDQATLRTYTSMGVLAHEAGHRWLSFVGLDERGNGAPTGRLLGAGAAHWSAHMDAEGSLMEGVDYRDNQDGTFTITDQTTTRFSPLDQYLMGFIPPSQVPGFFYLDNPNLFAQDDPTSADRINNVVRGDRVDASVNDIIAVEGRRVPGAGNSRKEFRIAFVLVERPGNVVLPSSITLVDTLRQQFPDYFQSVTNNIGTMRTALFPK